MFKLTMTAISSVFLGLFFGAVCKAESGTELSVFSPAQSSAIQRMIDSSIGNRLNSIGQQLDDLERRIKGDQSWSASDKDYKDYRDKDYKDNRDYKDYRDYRDRDYVNKDSSCPGPLCQPDSPRDREKGSPCWPSTCEGRDRSPCWPSTCEGRDRSPCGPSTCEGRDRSPCGPSTCELLRDRGSPCWPSGCGEKRWSCYGNRLCGREPPRRVDIHIYKHVYIHKHIYKHVYWHPPDIPCWDECGW